jgi:nitrate/TMAO reductase-like tetraheme cytochrome c subunit
MPRLPGLPPETPLGRWLARVSGGRFSPKGLRIVGFSAGLAVGFGLIAMLFAVQVSSTPQFCGTCHIMKPYFESWRHSKHANIACVECHIPPGITAEFRKKFEALSMVAKYFTGTYSTNPWVEVDDAACLRCHERRLLQGKEVFHNVLFDHTPHLSESRRGLKLRCTSCHSQIVQGSHISVTSSTCALCHFKGQKINQGSGRCQLCHQIPDRVTTSAGTSFDHSEVRRLSMECSACHAGVVRGDGTVPRERCVTCHNEAARLAEYGNRDLLHRKHVSEHKVNCMNCHLEIQHGRPEHPAAETADAAGSCQSCHGSGHSPQRDLYAGIGGRGVPRMPGPMFVAGVTCEGCHNPSVSPAASTVPFAEQTQRASAVSCMSCHGPGYLKIYEAWKGGVDSRLAALRSQMQATAAAMVSLPPQDWQDAQYNFNLVERGHGIHNVNFAYALLEKAHDQMNAARSSRGLAALALPWTRAAKGSGNCLTCHQGIERQAGTFAGRAFSHRPHLGPGNLACASCHRPHEERAPGEVVRFGETGCLPCHHPGPEVDAPKCAKCHGDITAHTVPSFRGEFSHKAHLETGVECSGCHKITAGDPRPEKSACAQCHEAD